MKTALITAAIAATFATTAIAAPPTGEAQSTQVEYADLDLPTEKGQKTLDKRITKAARAVCAVGEQRTGSRVNRRESRECFNNAKAQVKAQFAEIIADARRGG